jgi:hypothetical protein
VLRARERAPTPYAFVVFTFGLTVESIKELRGASKLISKGCKGVFCTNVVWSVFHVSKVDIAASRWSKGEDITPKPLSYDVWKQLLKAL